MPLGPLYVLLGEVSVQVFCPIFKWIFCLSGLELSEFFPCFGDQTLVLGVICKYIFPYGWFSFHINAVFFSCAEAFKFDKIPFVYSFLYVSCLGDILVKILLHGISEMFLPMFSFRTFIASRLIFKSFIHLECIVVCGVSWWSSFIFFACSCPHLPTPFIEESIFTQFFASASFVK